MPLSGMHDQPDRAQSFGDWADEYDRYRPGYPAALAADLLAGGRRTVLDIGCGTGKAAVALAEQGGDVLGVEPDERMARIAIAHGIPTEVARFEDWNSRGRCFDVITCASTWHWLDPALTLPRIPPLLNAGGLLARIWNIHVLDDEVRQALDAVYENHPDSLDRFGHDPTDQPEPPDPLREVPGMAVLPSRTYHWSATLTTEQWLHRISTYTSHQLLGEASLNALRARVASVIDGFGGTITPHLITYCRLSRAGVTAPSRRLTAGRTHPSRARRGSRLSH